MSPVLGVGATGAPVSTALFASAFKLSPGMFVKLPASNAGRVPETATNRTSPAPVPAFFVAALPNPENVLLAHAIVLLVSVWMPVGVTISLRLKLAEIILDAYIFS